MLERGARPEAWPSPEVRIIDAPSSTAEAGARPRSRLVRSSWVLLAILAVAGLAWGVDAWRFAAEFRGANEDLARGRYRPARDRLARLAGRRPGRVDVALALGLAERGLGRIDEALASLGRVPPGSPEAGPIALRRAKIAMENGRLAVAEESLERALVAGGVNRDEALSDLARVLRLQGRMADVRPRLVAGLRDSSVPAELLRELFQLDNEALPIERIRAFLDDAGRRAPDDDRVWLGRANLAIRTGELEVAKEWLDRCRERRGDDPAVLRAGLDFALAADDPAEALRVLARPRFGSLRPSEASSLRAWFAARRGDRQAERLAIEGWLRDDPASVEALERLAGLDLDAGRLAEVRRRKSELDAIFDDYEKILARGDLGRAAELSTLAGRLGRKVEEHGWAAVAAGAPREALAKAADADPSPIPAARLVASLPPGGRPGPSSAEPPRPESRVAFVDDVDAAGLAFAFDNGRTPERQFPETGSGGVGLLDFDGDGWLDVYCIQGGPFPPPPGRPNADRLFRNKGDGTFEDATQSAGIAALPGGYGHGVSVGDFDNDGRPDLFLTRFDAYALLRNRGDGTFEDATGRAGLAGPRDWPTSAAFVDLDADGDLDLYVCHYLEWDPAHPRICRHARTGDPSYCDPTSLPHRRDRVFRNDGGKFEDVTESAGFVDDDGRGLGVLAGDLDDDGRVDLFVANDLTANDLFRNLGGLRFEEVGLLAGVAANAAGGYQAGMGTACGDVDGDGRLDLVVTNFYGESTTLYRNLGPGHFADQTAASGLAVPTRYMLGFGVAWIDADNDGDLDLIQANGHVNDFRPDTPYAMPTQLFLNDGRGRLADATARAGPSLAELRVGRGLAAGDLDNDGRPDALVVAYDRPLAYFHNRSPRDGHFVTLQLEGTTSNRDGVGAKVVLTAGGRRRVTQRFGGGSYQSANDGRLHFGLGPERRVSEVVVTWPSGRVDRFRDLPADAGYRLREGDASPTPLAGFPPPK